MCCICSMNNWDEGEKSCFAPRTRLLISSDFPSNFEFKGYSVYNMNLLQALIWMSLMLEISLASITSPSLFQEALQTDIEKRQATRTFHTTPDLPTQTGIPANCNKYYDVVSGDTCSAVETSFAITHPQFLAWNVCETKIWLNLELMWDSLLFLLIVLSTSGWGIRIV